MMLVYMKLFNKVLSTGEVSGVSRFHSTNIQTKGERN